MTRALVFLLLLLVSGCYTGSTPPPIEIGHVSDKTRLDKAGDQAELGMRLALHELNKDDALTEAFAGRKVQVRHTDTRGVIDAFESEAVRLDSVNRCVAILGGMSAAETSAIANAKTPILTFYGQPASGAGNHVFYLGMSPDRQGAALGEVVAADAKAMRVAVLLDEKRPEAETAADAFQRALADARKNGKPASVLTLRFASKTDATVDETRWREITEQMVNRTSDVVVFAGPVQDFNTWNRVARKAFPKFAPKLVFAGTDGAQRLFEIGDKAPVLLATAFHADPANEKATAFVKAYRDAFQTGADVNAALAYDGLRMLIDAMKKTPTQLTSEKLREKLLETKDFEGLTGKLTITADRLVTRPLFVVRWQNGTLKAVKTIAP